MNFTYFCVLFTINAEMRLLFLFLLIFSALQWIGCGEDRKGSLRIEHTLPVLKVEIAPHHLWSQDSGLYIIGSNGAERCGIVANFNQNWEFPVRATYKKDGQIRFNDIVGFRIRGNCSRSNAMKSFALYWKSGYGKTRLEYPLFEGTNTRRFKRVLFRNSGQDFNRTMLKDAAIQRTIRYHADIEYQEYQPVVVYMNDEYWGIHNMRERYDDRYFQYKFGVDNEKVELLTGTELNPIIEEGNNHNFFQEVTTYIKAHDFSIEEHYLELGNRIDLKSYIDYFIVETYIMNRDWPKHNTLWWREPTSGYTKWRWAINDTDQAMLSGWDNKIWIGDLYQNHVDEDKADGFYLFNKLIQNSTFRQEFLERYLYFIDVVFEPSRFESIVRGMQADIRDEYRYHALKWGTLSPANWDREINRMIRFNEKRNTLMRTTIMELLHEK